MYRIHFPKRISEQINANGTLFIDVRGTISFSSLSEKDSDKKPYYEVSLTDAHVIRNEWFRNEGYITAVDYLDNKIAELSRRGIPFYALDFNTYSVESAIGTLPLNDDGTFRAELARGIDVTLKLRLSKNPVNGIWSYTFFGIRVNEPARFYDYHLKRPVFFDEQAA